MRYIHHNSQILSINRLIIIKWMDDTSPLIGYLVHKLSLLYQSYMKETSPHSNSTPNVHIPYQCNNANLEASPPRLPDLVASSHIRGGAISSTIVPRFCPWTDQPQLSRWKPLLFLLVIWSINLPHSINPIWKKHHLMQIPHKTYVNDTNATMPTSKPRHQGYQTSSQVLTYVEVQYHPP